MDRVTSILIFSTALVILPLFLSSQDDLFRVTHLAQPSSVLATEEHPSEAGHASVPSTESKDSHPLKNIAKRRTDPPAPPFVIFSFILPFGADAAQHSRYDAFVALHDSVPFYQLFRVYRS